MLCVTAPCLSGKGSIHCSSFTGICRAYIFIALSTRMYHVRVVYSCPCLYLSVPVPAYNVECINLARAKILLTIEISSSPGKGKRLGNKAQQGRAMAIVVPDGIAENSRVKHLRVKDIDSQGSLPWMGTLTAFSCFLSARSQCPVPIAMQQTVKILEG